MYLVFGGAHQGKLDFVKNQFNIKDEDVTTCVKGVKLDVSKPVIYGLEDFVYACNLENIEPRDVLEALKEELADKIIISKDVSCGLVPMEPEERSFREMLGRTLVYLGKEADTVVRVFLGLPQVIKGEL